MKNPSTNEFLSDIKFFDLLLEQFKWDDGELPTSIAYLTQAMNEDYPPRKASLVRIAREKLRNSDTLGSILLMISRGKTGPLPGRVDRRQFEKFLANKGVSKEKYGAGLASLSDVAMSAGSGSSPKNLYHLDPRKYLHANIIVEEKQIITYEKLVSMTTDSNFVSALNSVQARQIQHRDEFVDMLRRLDR